MRPVHPTVQWVPEALARQANWSGCEDYHSNPSRANVKNRWSYTSTSPVLLRDVIRDISTFTFHFFICN